MAVPTRNSRTNPTNCFIFSKNPEFEHSKLNDFAPKHFDFTLCVHMPPEPIAFYKSM